MLRRYASPGLFLTALVLLAGGTAFPGPLSQEADPSDLAAAAAGSVLAFPFEDASAEADRDASLDWLEEGLSELTAERLRGHAPYVFSRQERLDALERVGLPASASLSRASILRLAESMDADEVIIGRYSFDGTTLSLSARLLRVSPPALSPELTESGPLADLSAVHARLAWRLVCQIAGGSSEAPVACADGTREAAFMAGLVEIEPQALELYIRGLRAQSDEDRVSNLRQAARLLPTWEVPAFALGEAYFAQGDCELALPWLSRIPPARPLGLQAGFQTGVCHLLRNDPARAEAAFSAVLNRPVGVPPAPRPLPEAHNDLGIALARAGKYSEAVGALQQATELDPGEPDYWFNLGIVFLRADRPDEAVGPLRIALALQPADAEARALLAVALERSGQSGEAAAQRSAVAGSAGLEPLPAELEASDLDELQRIRTRLDPGSLRPAPATPAPNVSPAALLAAPVAHSPPAFSGALP